MSINPGRWGQCVNILLHTGKVTYDDLYTESFLTECKRLYKRFSEIDSMLNAEQKDLLKRKESVLNEKLSTMPKLRLSK